MDDKMALSAKECREIDEITFNKMAAENTLKTALQYNTNQHNEYIKKEKEFWAHLCKTRDLDKTKKWMIDTTKSFHFIRKVTDND